MEIHKNLTDEETKLPLSLFLQQYFNFLSNSTCLLISLANF